MRRVALLLLVDLALAGCTRAARTAAAPPASTPPTITSSARPAGWKAVRYRGLSLAIPAAWRVRDGRKLPCPAILPRAGRSAWPFQAAGAVSDGAASGAADVGR
jgi:hypothetical protein